MSLAHAIVVINQLRFISLFITRGWHSFGGETTITTTGAAIRADLRDRCAGDRYEQTVVR